MAAVPGAGLKFVACRPSWVKPQRGMALRGTKGRVFAVGWTGRRRAGSRSGEVVDESGWQAWEISGS